MSRNIQEEIRELVDSLAENSMGIDDFLEEIMRDNEIAKQICPFWQVFGVSNALKDALNFDLSRRKTKKDKLMHLDYLRSINNRLANSSLKSHIDRLLDFERLNIEGPQVIPHFNDYNNDSDNNYMDVDDSDDDYEGGNMRKKANNKKKELESILKKIIKNGYKIKGQRKKIGGYIKNEELSSNGVHVFHHPDKNHTVAVVL